MRNESVLTSISNVFLLGTFSVTQGLNTIYGLNSNPFLQAGKFFLYYESINTQLTRSNITTNDYVSNNMTDFIWTTKDSQIYLSRIDPINDYKFNIEMLVDYPNYTDVIEIVYTYDLSGIYRLELTALNISCVSSIISVLSSKTILAFKMKLYKIVKHFIILRCNT